jgi:hypothetical protein
MTLYEFRELFIDESQEVKIYDISSDDVDLIYEGYFDEMPDVFEDLEISSLDNVYNNMGYVGINVDFSDDD